MKSIVFYDGECGMCNHWVQFMIKRDVLKQLYYVALQSDEAMDILSTYNVVIDPNDLKTIYYLKEGKVHSRSTAIIEMLEDVSVPKIWLRCLKVLPGAFSEAVYKWIARHRYQIFGRKQSCQIVDSQDRKRIIS